MTARRVAIVGEMAASPRRAVEPEGVASLSQRGVGHLQALL
jgi:hypothetical protein